MLDAVKSLSQMAVEAKEEQKTRMLLWDFQGGDDEEDEDDGWQFEKINLFNRNTYVFNKIIQIPKIDITFIPKIFLETMKTN